MKQMIKEIGNIVLDTPLWWVEYSTSDYFIEEVVDTIDGGMMTYRYPKKDKYITLSSGDGQHQSSITKDAIIALSRLDAPTTILSYDDDVINVEFVHSDGNAVVGTSVIDVRESDKWLLNIKLRTY